MTTPSEKYTVSTLQPKGPGGAALTGGATYELTKASVSPTRIVGRDRRGRAVYETVPIGYSQLWVHPSGTINNCVMRTGAVWSMHPDAVAYENEMTHVQISEGWIRLDTCPYTTAFREITGTPCLIDNPTNEPDCGGKPDGCSHLKVVITERLAAFKAEHDLAEAQFNAMSPTQARGLIEQWTDAMAALRNTASPADADDADDAKPVRPRAK